MMVQWIYVIAVVVVMYGGPTLAPTIPPPRNPRFSQSVAKAPQVPGLSEVDMLILNDYIIKYLLYFEKLRQASINDHLKEAMHVVKLHIVQSWVSTLEPEMGLLTIPSKERLQDIKNSIITSIMKLEHSKVKDYILYYVTKIEPQIRNELESEKNSLKYSEKVFYDDEKVLADKHDDETIALFQSTWKSVLEELNEIRSNLIIHKISSQMILQSYIANFITDRNQLGDKFTLTSSDGSINEFDTPDSDGKIFKDIMKISSEVDKDIKSNDKIKYEIYYQILNERIKNYLKTFDKLIEEESGPVGKAMRIVKSLIIQGWIETMKPEEEYFPIEKSRTLETTRNEIIKEITEVNGHFIVSDAILLYTDEKEERIEKNFKTNNDTLSVQYRLKLGILKRKEEKSETKGDTSKLKEELKELERKINVENDNIIAHRICKLFYLNSFREDFIPAQQQKVDFEVEGSKSFGGKAKTRVFNVPDPIDIKNFFIDFIQMDLD